MPPRDRGRCTSTARTRASDIRHHRRSRRFGHRRFKDARIKWLDATAVADTSGGSANVQNVSRAQARRNLEGVFATLRAESVARVVVGSGGIDTAHDAQALTELIQPLAPDAVVSVVHDTRLLLAATGCSTGIAVIAGTGWAAWVTNGEDQARAGGWGYLLGDEGSGYWFGREAVRYSLERMNNGLRPDELTQRASFGLPNHRLSSCARPRGTQPPWNDPPGRRRSSLLGGKMR